MANLYLALYVERGNCNQTLENRLARRDVLFAIIATKERSSISKWRNRLNNQAVFSYPKQESEEFIMRELSTSTMLCCILYIFVLQIAVFNEQISFAVIGKTKENQRRSVHWRIHAGFGAFHLGAGEGNRTPNLSLGSWCFTTKLHLHTQMTYRFGYVIWWCG